MFLRHGLRKVHFFSKCLLYCGLALTTVVSFILVFAEAL